jgi:hypothetical protein
MLLKITDFPDDLADSLKFQTAQGTASKAVLQAAVSYIPNLEQILSLRHHNELQAIEIQRLRNLIEQARSAAALLVDKTSQGELL